ncbi:MAG TPA: gephyrin-like molybdotransferase Glp [Planctomycetaceae bacterium]|nr:gephyrin-like molybdotransferase Glp [Planctomycetaceae bacterium]
MKFRDVRMRGFEKRARLSAVLDWLDAHIDSLPGESIPLAESAGRILAEEIVATSNIPAYRRSAMDGYAIAGEETTGASDYSPISFRVVGESWPGSPFPGTLCSKQVVRIMTGAPVPAGADAVLPAEQASQAGDFVEITGSVPPGKNVGAVGEDVREGTAVLPAGRRLRPQDVGLLASLGRAVVPVIRRPKVRMLITGNELAVVGQPIGESQIFDSNSPMLHALIARDSGELIEQLRLCDERQLIAEALLRPDADVVLVSGGSSVGAEDYAPSLLDELGELTFHGMAIRPASPAGVGRIGSAIVFLLPGNPVSCLCAYDLIAGRTIRRLAGRSTRLPYATREFVLSKKIVSSVGRLDYCRVCIDEESVFPVATSGASILSSTSRADGFVLVPEESEGYAVGTTVTVHLYDLPFDRPL